MIQRTVETHTTHTFHDSPTIYKITAWNHRIDVISTLEQSGVSSGQGFKQTAEGM